MNSSKLLLIPFGVIGFLLIFSCPTPTEALKCYVCTGKSESNCGVGGEGKLKEFLTDCNYAPDDKNAFLTKVYGEMDRMGMGPKGSDKPAEKTEKSMHVRHLYGQLRVDGSLKKVPPYNVCRMTVTKIEQTPIGKKDDQKINARSVTSRHCGWEHKHHSVPASGQDCKDHKLGKGGLVRFCVCKGSKCNDKAGVSRINGSLALLFLAVVASYVAMLHPQ